MNLEATYNFINETAELENLFQTKASLYFAQKCHEGQYRDGDNHIPYIMHPLTLARHALSLGIHDDDILSTLLLHDTVEDCGVALEDLPVSTTVKEAVSLVSFSINPGESKPEAKERYFNNISKNPIASFCKIIDRCNNVSTMAEGFSVERMIKYIAETEKYILPLIDNLEKTWPSYSNYCFILRYHIKSVLRAVKRFLHD